MPSPFPGMDPFVEHPSVFPGLHDRFIAYLSEALQVTLPAPYFAEINERLWIDTSERRIGPDVDVIRGGGPRSKKSMDSDNSGGVAVLAESPKPLLIRVPVEEYRQSYLEIRTPGDADERVVTTIEVLSPTNKTSGPKGRSLYLSKQREILDSDTHLVEIDLLRGGAHTTAIPLDRLQAKSSPFAYHVCVREFHTPEVFAVYPVRLQEKLPSIFIPLLPGDGNVTVDLQAVFTRCYDTGPYRRRVRYEVSRIDPPLEGEDLEWATQLLRAQGLAPEENAGTAHS